MELLLAVLLGLGLSAACGFRVFVPPLIASVAAMTGHLHLAAGFEWLGTPTVAIALAVAALLEVAGFYLPFVDHVLDMVTAPVTIIAGTLLTAAFVGDMDPMLKWSLAVIAGGGAALLVKGGVAAVRAASTATTGGLGNFIVATLEIVAACVLALLAILAPFLAIAAAVLAAGGLIGLAMKMRAKHAALAPGNLPVVSGD